MAHADAEHRRVGIEQHANRIDSITDCGRITRPVRQKNAIRMHGHDGRGVGGCRYNAHPQTAISQFAKNIAFATKIKGHHMFDTCRLTVVGCIQSVAALLPCIWLFAAHLSDQITSGKPHPIGGHGDSCGGIHAVRCNHAVLGTPVTQVTHQRPRINAGNADNAMISQPAIQIMFSPVV